MSLQPFADDRERHDCEVRTVARWPRREKAHEALRTMRARLGV